MWTYNPLDVDELGRNAARALMQHPADILPPTEQFAGAGVYTLHYAGDFAAYAGMGDEEPIYVGKTDMPGKRRGQSQTGKRAMALHNRLDEHAKSIEAADNLALSDFRCRWLVLNQVWIGLTEQILIAQYRPIWNAVVDGFGHHDQGKTRRSQQRSRWDTLHPGRPWATHFKDRSETAESIIELISEHWGKEPQ